MSLLKLFLARQSLRQVVCLLLAKQGVRLVSLFTRLTVQVALVQVTKTPGTVEVFIPFRVVVTIRVLRLPMSFRSQSLMATPPLPLMALPKALISPPKSLSRLLPQHA